MQTQPNKSPKKAPVISANLGIFCKSDLMANPSGQIGTTNQAASLERLVNHKAAIEAHTGGPFRVLQIGHWCNTETYDASVFVGWHGNRREHRKKISMDTFVERFSKWCFIFDQVKGSLVADSSGQSVAQPCFQFAQLTTDEWKNFLEKHAPASSSTPFSKMMSQAIRDSCLDESKNNVYNPQPFHIIPFVNQAILRNVTKHPQVWSVHVAMPASEWPSMFNEHAKSASQLFCEGLPYWCLTKCPWLPTENSKECILSHDAALLLDGPVSMLDDTDVIQDTDIIDVKESIKEHDSIKNNVTKDSISQTTSTFRCTFPSGITLVVGPHFFRKMFE